MEEKYMRVLATSLIAYGDLLAKICEKKSKAIEKGAEMHSNILQDPKFWKYAHHQNLNVSYFNF